MAALQTATAVVERLFDLINCRDGCAISEIIAEDCFYEDPNASSKPMRGRQAVVDFLNNFFAKHPDIKFVVEGITKDEPSCVGVMWHMECAGESLPCSKGCSFYRVASRNGKLQLTYGIDLVEPRVKHGLKALERIRAAMDKLDGSN